MLRLKPATPPAPDIADEDRCLAALNRGIEVVQQQVKEGRPPVGVVIILLEQYPGGGSGPTWLTQNLSTIETLGLLSMAMQDINDLGLDGADPNDPDCVA